MTLSMSCLWCANRHKAAGNRKRGGVKSQGPPNHFQHQKLLLAAGIPRQMQSFRSRSRLDVCPSPRTGPAPPRCARSAAGRWRHLLAPSGRSAQGCAPRAGALGQRPPRPGVTGSIPLRGSAPGEALGRSGEKPVPRECQTRREGTKLTLQAG